MSTNTAIVFPGQGSQRKGMAHDFYDEFPTARYVFERASEVLSMDIKSICHDDDQRLDLTEFTQPCLLTTEIAMFETLKKHFDLTADYFGGHSLGEYAALVAAGSIPFDTALRLVHARGKLMQESAPEGWGSMVAFMMEDLPRAEIMNIAAEMEVDAANDNSPTQLVMSGQRSQLDMLCQKLAHMYSGRGLRQVDLSVSAPFHSRHMKNAEKIFSGLLKEHQQDFDASKAKLVTSNFTGGFHTGETSDMLEALTRQISNTVKWRNNMNALMDKCSVIYELGPNRPLGSFFKSSGFSIRSITDLRTAMRAFR